MGVYWSDRKKVAFGMLVVPDGRIVCQRPTTTCFVRKWQATTFRKIADDSPDSSKVFAAVACMSLMNVFHIAPDKVDATHVVSHYVTEMNSRLELVMCKMHSPGQLSVSKYIEIKLVTFDQLLDGIEKDKDAYAPHTVHTSNIISTMASWV